MSKQRRTFYSDRDICEGVAHAKLVNEQGPDTFYARLMTGISPHVIEMMMREVNLGTAPDEIMKELACAAGWLMAEAVGIIRATAPHPVMEAMAMNAMADVATMHAWDCLQQIGTGDNKSKILHGTEIKGEA